MRILRHRCTRPSARAGYALWLICVLVPGATGLAGASSRPVKLVDGGFEKGEQGGPALHWHKMEGKGQAVLDPQEKVEGNCSLRLESPLKQQVLVASEQLGLAPLRRYRLALWARGTQGNKLGFSLEENGPDGPRKCGLQLHWPGRYRPNWIALYPGWKRYEAFFATGRRSTSWRLVISERCLNDALGDACWVDGASLTEIGGVKVAAKQAGPDNLLPPDVAGFAPDQKAWPRAWGSWWGPKEKVSTVPGAGHGGSHCLQVKLGPKDGSFCLVVPSIGVKEGYLYKFSIWARGSGNVQIAIHQLGDGPYYWCRPDTALRLGGTHPRNFKIDGVEWQRLEGDWIAEIPGMRWFNPYIVVSGKVDLSDASLR